MVICGLIYAAYIKAETGSWRANRDIDIGDTKIVGFSKLK
jgi:hypothetical protein